MLTKVQRDFFSKPRDRITALDLRDGHLLAGLTNGYVSSLRFVPEDQRGFLDRPHRALSFPGRESLCENDAADVPGPLVSVSVPPEIAVAPSAQPPEAANC